MKLLKYLPAVALTLASQGGQDLPGIALTNCKTELGLSKNCSNECSTEGRRDRKMNTECISCRKNSCVAEKKAFVNCIRKCHQDCRKNSQR